MKTLDRIYTDGENMLVSVSQYENTDQAKRHVMKQEMVLLDHTIKALGQELDDLYVRRAARTLAREEFSKMEERRERYGALVNSKRLLEQAMLRLSY